MKFLKIALFLFLLSCIDKTYVDEFVVENHTEYSIRIEGFVRNTYNFDEGAFIKNENVNPETILIPPFSTYTAFQNTRGYHANDPEGIFIQWYIDSVNIYFDEKKILKQFCDSAFYTDACSIDILDIDNNYIREKRNRNEYRYTYEITEKDYEHGDFIQE